MAKQPETQKKKRDDQTRILWNLIIVFVLALVLIFLWDAFLFHSIPAPEGTFDLDSFSVPAFDLAQSGTVYAGAAVLERYEQQNSTIYLVEWEGQLHLLDVRTHFVSQRSRLCKDILVPENGVRVYRTGWGYEPVVTVVQDGKIIYCQEDVFLTVPTYRVMMTIYVLAAAAIAFLESLIYRKATGRRWRKTREQTTKID
ncbi:MAG TPA: hypothetical protein IAC30_01245 [Candidatus Faecousia intestinavium]|nr:hypothetical protein [Candidatus Faecousia intestinavium]